MRLEIRQVAIYQKTELKHFMLLLKIPLEIHVMVQRLGQEQSLEFSIVLTT